MSVMVEAGPLPVIETSMSALGTFQRCRKKWYYQEKRGWYARSVPTIMEIGTLYHAALASGVGSLRRADQRGGYHSDGFLAAAVDTVYNLNRDRNNMPLHLDQGSREMVDDMIQFSFANYWREEISKWKTVLSVEEPAYIQIGRYLIRNTFDAVVEYFDDKRYVIDAKTVDDPRQSKEWIPLDFQTRSYPLAARGKWGVAMPFKHVFISRDVPPGFGHNPITTATGKTRNKKDLERMSQVANFVQEYETNFNDAQLDHFERKMVQAIMEIGHAEATMSFPETPIKIGPFACGQCPYYAPCAFEMDGGEPQFNPMLYIERGSEEWNALQVAVTP